MTSAVKPTLVHWLFLVSVTLAPAPFAAPAHAQAPKVSITMDTDTPRVAVGDRFSVTVSATVRGDGSPQVKLPSFSPFSVLSTNPSTQRRMRWSLGGPSLSEHVARYEVILQANRTGTFHIPRASVVVKAGQKRRVYDSKPLTITVDPGSGNVASIPSQTAPPPPPNMDPETMSSSERQDGFLRMVVDPAQVFVGQQVTASLFLYVRRELRQAPTMEKEPTTDGFWVQDLMQGQRLEPTVQQLGGKRYVVYRIRHLAAFPTRPGTLTIGPASMWVQLGGGSLFGPRPRRFRPASNPVMVTAKAIPDAASHRGNVVVGNFELSAALEPARVQTGDAMTLTVTATGQGNPAALALPNPELPSARVLRPQVRDEVKPVGDRVTGEKRWTWLIIPQRPGQHRIAPFELHTFDPVSRTHRTVTTEPLSFAATGKPLASAPPDPQRDPQGLNRTPRALPIPSLRTTSSLRTGQQPLSSHAGYWLIWALGPLSVATTWTSRRIRRAQRVKKRRHRTAHALKHVMHALDDPGQTAEPGQLKRLVHQGLSAILSTHTQGMTRDELHAAVHNHAGDQHPAEQITTLLADLESLQYGGTPTGHMTEAAQRTKSLLKTLRGAPRKQPT